MCLSVFTSPSIQKTARRAVTSAQSQRDAARAAALERDANRQAATIKEEADDVARRLAQLSMLQGEKEEENGIRWNDQQKKRHSQIEGVIRSEIEKRRIEEERLAKEEAERQRQEAAKVAAEEQRKREEAAKAAKEAEEAKAKADEEAARKRIEQIEQAKAQALEAQATERNALGMTTPDADWRDARLTLKVRSLPSFSTFVRSPSFTHNMPMQQLKSGPIARVKANRDLKKRWNEIRRLITPRVGQLTNDRQVIANIVS